MGPAQDVVASVLRVQGLAKRYKQVQALAGIDLEVRRGEVLGLLGPNGAGKTTFTKCVTGFVRPEAGSVELLGIDALRDRVQASHHVGLVPDQYDFYPNLTGRQHLDFYGRLHGLEDEERKSRVQELLAVMRMEESADRRTKGYSHGMKQRICIAQALLHRPALVFFDEPTNGLDPKGAYELRQLIRSLSRDGTSIVLNSHLLGEVEETCERVAILSHGRVLALESVHDLRNRFAGGVQVRMRLANPSQRVRQALERVVGAISMEGHDTYLFLADEATISDAVTAAVTMGARIHEVSPGRVSLESVFLQLTEDGA